MNGFPQFSTSEDAKILWKSKAKQTKKSFKYGGENQHRTCVRGKWKGRERNTKIKNKNSLQYSGVLALNEPVIWCLNHGSTTKRSCISVSSSVKIKGDRPKSTLNKYLTCSKHLTNAIKH